ncbi:hypothetical protein L1987_30116 [Smallanthus sonchifolius]|uniref:Uncharacterized protein n=1 Tax=Smallanthus sonchifolius TaxID=185202 RepID=A0ACB9I3Q0_9ASTR|nr:hypothetical protein L1987_30116 [Smallanthus sonchifolius]
MSDDSDEQQEEANESDGGDDEGGDGGAEESDSEATESDSSDSDDAPSQAHPRRLAQIHEECVEKKRKDSTCVFVSGVLHWIAIEISGDLGVIVAFSLASESFRELLLPPSFNDAGIMLKNSSKKAQHLNQSVDKSLQSLKEEDEQICKDVCDLLIDDEAASTRDAIG